jgi:hypothetical protein
MVYVVVKLGERKFVVAREGLSGVFTALAECKSESAATDVARLLNEHPESAAKAVVERKEREAARLRFAKAS